MALNPGARVGPYEIVGAIGAGGMGEVYRAHDARLNRDVAIKVLPASFAGDPERLQRFEVEAQAAGRLNHPNVLTVYDVGVHEGAPYLVTELLDGETLRERLRPVDGASQVTQTALPLRKVMDVGRQVALGLAAAHGAGIVHRDLKPENVFLTSDGRAKILDFGLARMTERAAGDGSAATALQVTNPGMVLGTVGYMSPEQVRGRPADARSDLFALGAMLFEMAGGRRAFERDSAADTMAAILKEDPPDLAASGVTIPPAFDRLIRRCLEKNPDERFQSARDLAFAVEALDGSSSGATSISGAVPAIDGPRRTRRRLGPILAVVGMIASAVLGFLAERGGWFFGGGPASGAPDRFTLRQLTFSGQDLGMPALSPDGSTFAFVDSAGGNLDIYVQRVGGETAINVTKDSPAADIQPAFSPDGSRIAFCSTRSGGGIWVMGASGESVRRITTEGFNPSWSPDGKELAYSTEAILVPTGRTPKASIWRVDVATGAQTKVYDGDGVQPSWSPDSKFLVFWGLPGNSGHRAIWTIPARTDQPAQPTLLIDSDAMNWNPIWSHDSRWVYFLSDREPPMNVWRLPVDAATGASRGAPERVTLGTANHSWLTQEAGGAMVFAATDTTTVIERRAVSPETGTIGAAEPPILRTTRDIGQGAASPDGRLLVMTVTDATEDLIAMKTDGTGLVRLTNDAFRDRMPSWSPDSTTVYFASDRSGQYEAWRIHSDGSGLEQVTRRKTPGIFGNPVPSPDNHYLSMVVIQPTPWAGLVDLTAPSEAREIRPVLPPGTPGTFAPLGWLRDGRLVGTIVDRRETAGVVLYRLDDKSMKVLPAPGLIPTQLVGDRYVACPDEQGHLHLLDLTTGAIRATNISPAGNAFLSADGRTAFVIRTESVRNLWMIKH